ncbi:MAG: 23S rRNA (guanosine(2251)-2'-O)-methyltransferase RlmB [Candidatus Binatia bacterium]
MKGRRHVNARTAQRDESALRWVYGLNAVARRIEAQPDSVRELRVVVAPGGRRNRLVAAATAVGIRVREDEAASLTRLTGSDAHQGIAALVEGFDYADLEGVLGASAGPVLVLDQIQDPHNLGALVRTAAAVGMAAVVIPRHGAVPVTAAVEKVAAGAVNDVPICRAPNLHRCLLDLRRRNYWCVGLSARGERNLFELDLPDQFALVVGGETGLRPLVESTCDVRVSIPQRPDVESLNAAVAGAVAMYELARRTRRLPSGKPR